MRFLIPLPWFFRPTASAGLRPRWLDLPRLFLVGLGLMTTAWPAEAKDVKKPKPAAAPAPVVQESPQKRAAREVRELVEWLDPEAVRLAVADLSATHGKKYAKGAEYLRRLRALEPVVAAVRAAKDDLEVAGLREKARAYLELTREALLANPLLAFDRLLLIRRSLRKLGLPTNWNGNTALPLDGYDNEIAVLSPLRPDGQLRTLFRPEQGQFVGDLDLHWDGKRLLFSMPGGENGRWHLWEIKTTGGAPERLTRFTEPDVDAYDGCYLPDGGIVFMCSATYQGVPCVGGKDYVANLYRMEGDGGKVRRLCYDQEMNWSPMVMHDGRVVYTRWEYTDTAHYFSRVLFAMNPDGTGQQSLYGSNSYWPNSMFYARQVPGAPSKFVTIVSGHHGAARMGELVLLDLARGREEADGVVQRIPGRGRKVEPVIKDQLVNDSWPKFLHPHPLNEKYFLVSCQLRAKAPWGIYLADVFDNLALIHELPEQALFEPLPLAASPMPQVLPDRVRPEEKEATVLLTDVYAGPGLSGVPRGAVKALRVFAYHFAYRDMGGHDVVGVQSSWDIKRVLGTVPVETDGSASFKIPANTPVAVQPLDAEGRALQLMRSWLTGQPGEVVSCVGCHDRQNTAPPARGTIASRRAPSTLKPWYGPARPFAFVNEVQPVLDRHCVSCHDGKTEPGAQPRPNFAAPDQPESYRKDPAYLALHPYVRRPGPESDYHLAKPMEYHADTSELVQLLKKGHHGVQLDVEAWDRLYTWIDLNAPWLGQWSAKQRPAKNAPAVNPVNARVRRQELARLYSAVEADPEQELQLATAERARLGRPAPRSSPPLAGATGAEAEKTAASARAGLPPVPGWPFDAVEAKRRQQAAGGARTTRTLDLGDGVTLELVLVPAGRFAMGDAAGAPDERAVTPVAITRAFWMGRVEITNRQFARFDARHDSRYIDQQWKDHTTPGYPANLPEQPVIRVTWEQARQFCAWLARRSGEGVALPTEAQWEWACRAGTETACWYGPADANFATRANLADRSLQKFAVRGVNPQPMPKPGSIDAFIPQDDAVDDGAMIAVAAGSYEANPWGLCDMHGNVAEWTRTTYRPYPYLGNDGREAPATPGAKVVRGGSWRDRPERARSAFRLAYEPWQPVFNVGFRIVVETQ